MNQPTSSPCPTEADSDPSLSPNFQRLLNYGEAARWLGVSLRQFRRLVDDGKIPIVRINQRSPRVRPVEIDAYITAMTVKWPEANQS